MRTIVTARVRSALAALVCGVLTAVAQGAAPGGARGVPTVNASRDTAMFGGGCFWCTEAIFSRVDGVLAVMPGYSGGTVANPTYEQVCGGATGHAEVVRIEFDPTRVSYDALLDVFFDTHDPTTLNRQGHDVGTQYRSVVFWFNEAQRAAAEAKKRALAASGRLARPPVTEISPAGAFYPAEDYHREYFARHPDAPYCRAVIRPKVEKFEERGRGLRTPHPEP